MQVKLLMVDPDGAPTGQIFTFDGHDTFLFGRDPTANCRIVDDPAVSRHHFILEVIPPLARLRDLGSKNGVRVNNVLYGGKNGLRSPDGGTPPIDLKHGDLIRVGKTVLEFQVDHQAGARSADVELDLFCEKCGAILSDASVVRIDGKVYCMTCRLSVEESASASSPAAAIPPSPPPGGSLSSVLASFGRSVDGPPSIPGYAISRRIGKGGMGEVYHAIREADGHPVAIKILLTGRQAPARNVLLFQREISISRSLSHPNIVTCHDDGSIDGQLYLIMEYLSGGCLAKRLKKHGPIAVRDALPIMRQSLAGIAAAHERNLIHRDIKPANILLEGERGNVVVKVTDFGLAKSIVSSGLSGFTATGTAAGTPTCVPPEQLSNFKRVTSTADIFSLAATFYEMLVGRSPYNFDIGKDPISVILNFDITPLAVRAPKVPAPLAAFIDTCLVQNPEQRFPNAQAMLDAFNKLPSRM